MSDPLFRFHMRYVKRREDHYYHARWDLAVPAQVLGTKRDMAIDKLLKVLGEPGMFWEWAVVIDQVEELLPPAEGDEHG